MLELQAARGWLRGVRDTGILVYDAEQVTGCDK